MECIRFEINLISASELEKVRTRFRMKVYAAVSISGNQKTEKRTPVDKENETNPAWNCSIKYTVGEKAVEQEAVRLVIKLYCECTFGDRYIGEVHTSIKELYDKATANGGGTTLTYKVQKGSAISQGELKFSCSFGEKVIIEQPSYWKKLLMNGAIFFLRVTIASTTGIAMPIDIPIFIDPDYACET